MHSVLTINSGSLSLRFTLCKAGESLPQILTGKFGRIELPDATLSFMDILASKKGLIIGELSGDESPYLFSEIPVEILGSVYERFLGKVVRPHGRGIVIEEKPEVRKAEGVYCTPRYLVDYIVEQTAGKFLDEIAAEKEAKVVKAFATRTERLRLLDPACGSGSFLISALERVCEHWQKRLTANLREAMDAEGRAGSPLPAAERGETSATHDGAHGVTRPISNRVARAAWEKKHRPLCRRTPKHLLVYEL